VQLPVALRRLAYRVAYRLLVVYWFLVRPTLTGVKFLPTDGDRVLLVRHTYGPSKWDVPGGAIKRREPPMSAARRELREELGLDLGELTSLGELAVTLNWRPGSLHCFQAALRAPRIELDHGELADARWFQRTALPANVRRYVREIVALTGSGERSSAHAGRTIPIQSSRGACS
jgi:8-oxo-dGTP pyrophosphatase MutT (NUDIX family)